MNIKLSAVEHTAFIRKHNLHVGSEHAMLFFKLKTNMRVPIVRVRVDDDSVTVVHNPDQISIDEIKYQIKHSL